MQKDIGRSVLSKRVRNGGHAQFMRVAMATVVALLFLNFVDEHFNKARYTNAAVAMFSHITKSFS